MRILFIASEGLPFCKTGGLADVIEALPKALVTQGHDVAVVLPRYRNMPIKNVSVSRFKYVIGLLRITPRVASTVLEMVGIIRRRQSTPSFFGEATANLGVLSSIRNFVSCTAAY